MTTHTPCLILDRVIKPLLFSASIFTIAACGGGSDDSNPTTPETSDPTPPTNPGTGTGTDKPNPVTIGLSIGSEIEEGARIPVTASVDGDDGNASYQWTLTKGSGFKLFDADTATPTVYGPIGLNADMPASLSVEVNSGGETHTKAVDLLIKYVDMANHATGNYQEGQRYPSKAQIGTAYDSNLGVSIGVNRCVTEAYSESVGQETWNFDSSLEVDYEYLYEFFQTSASGGFGDLFKAAASYTSINEAATNSTGFVLEFAYNGNPLELDNPKLKDEYQKLAESSPAQFRQFCGDQYVGVKERGGRLFVGVLFEAKTSSSMESFKSAAKLNIPIGKDVLSFGGSLRSAMISHQDELTMTIKAQMVGGDGSLLGNLFNGSAGNMQTCTGSHMLTDCANIGVGLLEFVDAELIQSFRENPYHVDGKLFSYSTIANIGKDYLAPEVVEARKNLDELAKNADAKLNYLGRFSDEWQEPVDRGLYHDTNVMMKEHLKASNAYHDLVTETRTKCYAAPIECESLLEDLQRELASDPSLTQELPDWPFMLVNDIWSDKSGQGAGCHLEGRVAMAGILLEDTPSVGHYHHMEPMHFSYYELDENAEFGSKKYFDCLRETEITKDDFFSIAGRYLEVPTGNVITKVVFHSFDGAGGRNNEMLMGLEVHSKAWDSERRTTYGPEHTQSNLHSGNKRVNPEPPAVVAPPGGFINGYKVSRYKRWHGAVHQKTVAGAF